MDKQLIIAIQQLTAAINRQTDAINSTQTRKWHERLKGQMLAAVDRALDGSESVAALPRE